MLAITISKKLDIMAIFGAGSKWEDQELKDDFIKNDYFIIGWNFNNAKDVYNVVASLKAGDIIYLKANQAGSRNLRIKAIGVVKNSIINHIVEKNLESTIIKDWNSFYIPVKWIVLDEFHIHVPLNEGRLTNTRSSTFFEEYLPFVQKEILNKLYKLNFKNYYKMDYGLGQFVTGVISVGLQIFNIWRETRNPQTIQEISSNFENIVSSPQIIEEGNKLEYLIPTNVLNTLKNRVEVCWTNFDDAVGNLNITPNELDRYTEGLRQCICRELKVILRLNSEFPNATMEKWWDQYNCENQ